MTITTLMCNILYFVSVLIGLFIVRGGNKYLHILLIVLICFVCYANYKANTIVRTEYTIKSNKINSTYKVLFISDIHYGAVQQKSVFSKFINSIENEEFDLVALGGDIIEECTDKDELEVLFREVSRIKNRFGIYFIYGNHDLQADTLFSKKYNNEYLVNVLNENNIIILNDNYVCINDDLVLIGRYDFNSIRKDISEFNENIDNSKLNIVIDHQPVLMGSNRDSGIDLQLSGHTHAGQIFPIGRVIDKSGNPIYGYYKYDTLELVVSSGFGVGGLPMRTERSCEYVVVHLVKED